MKHNADSGSLGLDPMSPGSPADEWGAFLLNKHHVSSGGSTEHCVLCIHALLRELWNRIKGPNKKSQCLFCVSLIKCNSSLRRDRQDSVSFSSVSQKQFEHNIFVKNKTNKQNTTGYNLCSCGINLDVQGPLNIDKVSRHNSNQLHKQY